MRKVSGLQVFVTLARRCALSSASRKIRYTRVKAFRYRFARTPEQVAKAFRYVDRVLTPLIAASNPTQVTALVKYPFYPRELRLLDRYGRSVEALQSRLQKLVVTPAFQSKCFAGIVKLSGEHNLPVSADNTASVLFEVKNAYAYKTPCVSAFLKAATIARQADISVVRAPGWVCSALRTLDDNRALRLSRRAICKFGAPLPNYSETTVSSALALWDPLSDSVYQDFGAALVAADLLV